MSELRVLFLMFLLLVSALGIVYVKDLNRRLFIANNNLQRHTEQLQADSNKLLLDKSSWSAQSRVQVVAQRQLRMQIPSSSEVMMIRV